MRVRSISGLSDRKRDRIFEHVFTNKDREVAGVLIGEHFEDGSLWIVDHIPAEEADEQAAAVTFTHESWDRILKIKDTDFADQEIVGWYHSHPGYGLFLSNDDMFLHRNFFPAWWQIAYVVDPVNEEGGIFVWEESEMEMFDRHEATFGNVGASSLIPRGGDSLSIPAVREKLPKGLLPDGTLGLALAMAGVLVLLIIFGFVLIGFAGSGGEDPPTVAPTEQPASNSKDGEVAGFENQFPRGGTAESYSPITPPAPAPPSKSIAPTTTGGGISSPAPNPPPSSGGGVRPGGG